MLRNKLLKLTRKMRRAFAISAGIVGITSINASAMTILDDSNFSSYETTGVSTGSDDFEIVTTGAISSPQINMTTGGRGLSATGGYTLTVNSTNEFVVKSTATGGYGAFFGVYAAGGNLESKSDLKIDIVDGRGMYIPNGGVGTFDKKVTILTSGRAIGLMAYGTSPTSGNAHFKDEVSLQATGDNSYGIVTQQGNPNGAGLGLTFDKKVTVEMLGANSTGISTQDISPGGTLTGSTIHFKDGLDIETTDGIAIESGLGSSEILIDGTSRIVSKNLAHNAIEATAGTVAINGQSTILGNVEAVNSGVVDLHLLAGSMITGKMDNYSVTTPPSGYTAGRIDMDFQGTGSIWELTDTSYVNTIDGTGIFKLHTNVLSQTGDELHITDVNGARGNHGLIIADSGVGSVADTYEHPVVFTNGGDATFAMNNGVLANVGAFQYDVKQDGNNWVLYRSGSSLSPTAAASLNDIRAGYLVNYSETQSLLQRMGELRNEAGQGNVWGKLVFGEFDVNGDAQLSGFHQTFRGVQVGADKNIRSGKNAFYLGGMFGYTDSRQSYETGRGEIDSYYVGAYGTYMAENGFYVDTVLKYGWQDQELRLTDNMGNSVRGKTKNNGFVLSSEVGYRHYLDKEAKKGWYLEPQGQLTLGRFSSDDFRTTNGMEVEFDSYNMALGRAGLLVGYELKSGDRPVHVYGKVSYNHEFSGNLKSHINGDGISTDLGSSWWTYGLGVSAQLGNRHQVYLDIERANGGEFTQLWKFNGGYRFTW